MSEAHQDPQQSAVEEVKEEPGHDERIPPRIMQRDPSLEKSHANLFMTKRVRRQSKYRDVGEGKEKPDPPDDEGSRK